MSYSNLKHDLQRVYAMINAKGSIFRIFKFDF